LPGDRKYIVADRSDHLFFRIAALIAIVAVFALRILSLPVKNPPENLPLFCTRVLSGDSIEIRWKGETEIVRLIGVDAPEQRETSVDRLKYGKERLRSGAHDRARDVLKGLVENKIVFLRFCPAIRLRGRTSDRRIRAYVYTYRKGRRIDVNAEMCRQGYTYWHTPYPYDRRREFKRYVDEAKKAGRGLWGWKR
jgi:endonuclease YncB( thermonuclease family)